MTVDMRDIADVLRAAGVPVVEEGDWQHRGTGGSFNAQDLMLHHDASPPGSSSGSADYIIDNLLSQLWLAYDGTWHVIAAGRMNHAGKGSWPGVPTDNANATFIGIETDHTTNESWTSGQRTYGIRGLLALADWLGIRDSADDLHRHLIAHKEWAPDRKVDPDPLDMDDLRAVILDPPSLEAPVRTVQKSTSTEKVLIGTEWKTLLFTDDPNASGGQWCLAQGPGDWFEATVEVYAEGPAGTQFYLRAYREESDVDKAQYPIRAYEVPPAGIARVELHESGTMKDSGERLRVRGKTLEGGPNVTLIYTRGSIALY